MPACAGTSFYGSILAKFTAQRNASSCRRIENGIHQRRSAAFLDLGSEIWHLPAAGMSKGPKLTEGPTDRDFLLALRGSHCHVVQALGSLGWRRMVYRR